MSHFTVAVITAKKEKLEEMLAPYDENLEVAPYINRTKKQIIENAKDFKTRFLREQKEGKKLDEWQKEYINAETDEELYQAEIDEDYQYDEEGKMKMAIDLAQQGIDLEDIERIVEELAELLQPTIYLTIKNKKILDKYFERSK